MELNRQSNGFKNPVVLPAGLVFAPIRVRALWLHVRGFTIDNRVCFAAQGTLAQVIGLRSVHSDRQVRRIIDTLEDAGWLTVKPQGRGKTLLLWTKPHGRAWRETPDISPDIQCPHPRTSNVRGHVRTGTDISPDIQCPPSTSSIQVMGGHSPSPPPADPTAPLFDPPAVSLWDEASGAGLSLGEALELAVGERKIGRLWPPDGQGWMAIVACTALRGGGAKLELANRSDPTGRRTLPVQLSETWMMRSRDRFRP